MIQSPIDKLRIKTVSETLNPFKPTSMKPTPITDILNKKLYKLHEEVDALIVKKVKKDLTADQWNSLESLERKRLSTFVEFDSYRLTTSMTSKIELFKRLEEL